MENGCFIKQAIKDGKRCVTANWLNDCLKLKKMQPPWRALHFPVISYPLHPSACKEQVSMGNHFPVISNHFPVISYPLHPSACKEQVSH